MISENPAQIKQRIKQQFSFAAQNYDSKAGFQKKSAEELLDFILLRPPHSAPRTILDIGCGTGFLTMPLAEKFPKAKVFACDIAHSMIKVARCRLQDAECKMKFQTADCESLPYKNGKFDLIASNLTYQWASDLDAAFKEAHRVLEKDGLFAFSMLGQKTFKELRECYQEACNILNKNGLPPFMRFFSKDDILDKLEKTGFLDINGEAGLKIEHYPSMLELLKALKSIGAGNPFSSGGKNLGKGMMLKRMADVYAEKFSAGRDVYASYEVFLFTAIK